MRKILMLKFFVLIFFTCSAFAQTPQKIEQELVAAIKNVQKYSNYGSNSDYEKLIAENDVFEEKLLKYTKDASTLKYNFPSLSKLLMIATTDDGRFRTYSWDMETGGTMHDFTRVYQYQGADGKIYSRTDGEKAEGDAGSFVYSIFTTHTKTGNVYVVCSTFIGSTMDHYGAASLYRIEKNALVDKVKLFKTREGLTDEIGFEYNFFSVVNRKERPVKLILYDKKTQTVKIPIVIQEKDLPIGKVTNRFINYRFDGKYFVKVK